MAETQTGLSPNRVNGIGGSEAAAVLHDEQWREVSGFPNYEVSTTGGIRSKLVPGTRGKRRFEDDRTVPLAPISSRKIPHPHVSLTCKEGRQQVRYVHRLVLETFIGPCPPGMECRHLNDNPLDNRLDNLVWGTRAENYADRRRNGIWVRPPGVRGEKHPRAKLSAEDVRQIRATYPRKTMKQLAEDYGVSDSSICYIIHRQTWRNSEEGPNADCRA